ncbi:hypothetical protein XELAEV_18022318mg [Xenopus laevis]|uniref:Uncharacterized protein n=1 Tax=Xenopus laevis TaxID=8355 RepID=A0A974D4K1_XENLA|nr:hypothetical protein XELAEV_18022318mg [Xenopus laevis]
MLRMYEVLGSIPSISRILYMNNTQNLPNPIRQLKLHCNKDHLASLVFKHVEFVPYPSGQSPFDPPGSNAYNL